MVFVGGANKAPSMNDNQEIGFDHLKVVQVTCKLLASPLQVEHVVDGKKHCALLFFWKPGGAPLASLAPPRNERSGERSGRSLSGAQLADN